MPITSDNNPKVTVSFTDPDEIRTMDINEARRLRKDIDTQIKYHEEEGVLRNMLNSVTSFFKGE